MKPSRTRSLGAADSRRRKTRGETIVGSAKQPHLRRLLPICEETRVDCLSYHTLRSSRSQQPPSERNCIVRVGEKAGRDDLDPPISSTALQLNTSGFLAMPERFSSAERPTDASNNPNAARSIDDGSGT